MEALEIKSDLLLSGRVLDAVAQLTLVALAAGEGDVGQQVEHFAGGRWGRARRFQAMSPLGGWGDGRG